VSSMKAPAPLLSAAAPKRARACVRGVHYARAIHAVHACDASTGVHARRPPCSRVARDTPSPLLRQMMATELAEMMAKVDARARPRPRPPSPYCSPSRYPRGGGAARHTRPAPPVPAAPRPARRSVRRATTALVRRGCLSPGPLRLSVKSHHFVRRSRGERHSSGRWAPAAPPGSHLPGTPRLACPHRCAVVVRSDTRTL